MSNNVFELTNFKDYLPLDLDITDKTRLVYRPVLAPTQLKCSLEPALTEEQLYVHMKENSNWSFEYNGKDDFYKQDCIDFLRDTDFQSFSQYGKLVDRKYIEAKRVYLFDSYFRNFLQEILERIEVFLKKSTADALTIGYNKSTYIFEDDAIYYSEQSKYRKENSKRQDIVLKTKYHLSRLILEKQDDATIKNQINQYGVVLPWTVFRLMTFGNIASFLVALQPEYRNKVAAYISLPLDKGDNIPAKILLSWCNALRYLRNICSHNGRLYGRLHHTLPAFHHSDRELLVTDSENDSKTLFIYFITMRHLILSMSVETQNFWNKKLQKFLEESHQEQVDLRYYGFPKNWMDLLAIKI